MLGKLLKYRRLILVESQGALAHRFSVFCSIAVFIFPVVAKVVFWKAVYGAGEGDIASFDVTDMVMYLLVFNFVFETTWVYKGGLRHDILGGGLTRYLLMPANYVLARFFEEFGTKPPRWVSSAFLFIVLLLFFRQDLRFVSDLWVYPAGALAMGIGFVLGFLLWMLVGFVTFWTESDVPFIDHAYRLFSGFLVPIVFLPEWLEHVGAVLPFQYVIYFPAMVLIGKVEPAAFAHGIATQLVMIAALVLAIHLVLKRGVRRYGAYGG